jgi:hypothetical protein
MALATVSRNFKEVTGFSRRAEVAFNRRILNPRRRIIVTHDPFTEINVLIYTRKKMEKKIEKKSRKKTESLASLILFTFLAS